MPDFCVVWDHFDNGQVQVPIMVSHSRLYKWALVCTKAICRLVRTFVILICPSHSLYSYPVHIALLLHIQNKGLIIVNFLTWWLSSAFITCWLILLMTHEYCIWNARVYVSCVRICQNRIIIALWKWDAILVYYFCR